MLKYLAYSFLALFALFFIGFIALIGYAAYQKDQAMFWFMFAPIFLGAGAIWGCFYLEDR